MSHENIELIKNIYGLFNERKYDAIIPHFAENMTWIAADSSPLADESPEACEAGDSIKPGA